MIPKLTAEEIKKHALTPGEIKLMESQPGVAYETFLTDWVEGQLPLERIRALDINTDGLRPWQFGLESGQPLFGAPTVFNYYPADYTLPGSTVPAPEFGIFTSAEFLNRANQFNDLLYFVDQGNASVWAPQPFLANAIGTSSPALTPFLADAGDAAKLVERLNRLFLHGTMRENMRQSVVTAVNKIAPTDPLRRVKMALNLIVVSIDYQVQK